MKLTFIETSVFSKRWHSRLDDEALRKLQNTLQIDPDRGVPIPGCGLLRKVRFGDESRGKGKRGGVRVIYMHTPEAQRIDLFTVFGKDDAENLGPDEIKTLCLIAHRVRDQLRENVRRELHRGKDA